MQVVRSTHLSDGSDGSQWPFGSVMDGQEREVVVRHLWPELSAKLLDLGAVSRSRKRELLFQVAVRRHALTLPAIAGARVVCLGVTDVTRPYLLVWDSAVSIVHATSPDAALNGRRR